MRGYRWLLRLLRWFIGMLRLLASKCLSPFHLGKSRLQSRACCNIGWGFGCLTLLWGLSCIGSRLRQFCCCAFWRRRYWRFVLARTYFDALLVFPAKRSHRGFLFVYLMRPCAFR